MDWKEFEDLCVVLYEKIVGSGGMYKGIYGVPTGGCFVAMKLSGMLKVPQVLSPVDGGVLVVDDIVDSGRTIGRYGGFDTAALLVKPRSMCWPKFWVKECNEWVEFPWEVGRKETVEDNVVRILEFIGENPNRDGLIETPERVARMYGEIFGGYKKENRPRIAIFENGKDGIFYDQMIVDSGEFCSFCEHHMLPFFGKFFIGILPDRKIMGLSKFARIVKFYSSRLQLQERLVKEIADELESQLEPKGLGVVLMARHLCKEIRGVGVKGEMVTSDLRGVFRESLPVKEEFMSWISTVVRSRC